MTRCALGCSRRCHGIVCTACTATLTRADAAAVTGPRPWRAVMWIRRVRRNASIGGSV